MHQTFYGYFFFHSSFNHKFKIDEMSDESILHLEQNLVGIKLAYEFCSAYLWRDDVLPSCQKNANFVLLPNEYIHLLVSIFRFVSSV